MAIAVPTDSQCPQESTTMAQPDPSASRSGTRPGSEHYHLPRSSDDLTEQNVRAIVELERTARASRSPGDRLAASVASFCGTIQFAWLHALGFAAWIVLNTWPGWHHPDPYPFTFLTMVVSLEAIFLSTFVLISQNEEARLAERRNALDLQINLLAEQENTKMLRMLDRIAGKLGVTFDDDPSLAVLERATRPDRLAEQIDRIQNDEGLEPASSR
jgi:uncharacterized membrane protein